jgi:nitrate reductase gamma subunit
MKPLVGLVAVVALLGVALLGVGVLELRTLFGVVLPYAAFATFVVGLAAKVVGWGRVPVPFHITTTCGQQQSLRWVPQSRLENPSTTWGVLGRMALEILLFRSLFRNTETKLQDGKLGYLSTKWLWAAGLVFHWSMLVVVVRHLRLFLEPVPSFVTTLSYFDGFLQVGAPPLFITTALFLGALTFLFLRRVLSPKVAYLSLPADYFSLFLLLGIGSTGAWMRHIDKVDVSAVKEMMLGLAQFSPKAAPVGWLFYGHLLLVSALVAYFPISKLMHAPGVFLSPTRNMTGNSRAERHVNPWNPVVEVHTYEEYEDEFRARMKEAGLPVEKE